jgi:hypothetical protein
VGQGGRVIRKSPAAYSSLAAAVTEAAFCGFDPSSDGYQVLELD